MQATSRFRHPRVTNLSVVEEWMNERFEGTDQPCKRLQKEGLYRHRKNKG